MSKRPTDWAALERSTEGTDAHRERRPAFRGVGHALAWYLEHGERLRAAKTTMGHALDRAELGLAHDVGGRGSTLERELALLGDVGACLPKPGGAEAPTDAWGRWWTLCASVQGVGDVDELARRVGDRMGLRLGAQEVRVWLREATRAFRDALLERGLIPRPEGWARGGGR